jgi:hypothetical protein
VVILSDERSVDDVRVPYRTSADSLVHKEHKAGAPVEVADVEFVLHPDNHEVDLATAFHAYGGAYVEEVDQEDFTLDAEPTRHEEGHIDVADLD